MNRPLSPFDRISRACFRSFADLPGARLLQSDTIFGVMTDVPLSFFNGIASSVFRNGDLLTAIDEARRPFLEVGRPFRWWITPGTEPENLAPILAGLGMRHAYDALGMTADLSALPSAPPEPAGISIEIVSDEETMRRWSALLLDVFEAPPDDAAVWATTYARLTAAGNAQWTHFAAIAGGEIVASAAVLVAGDLAGIYHVATHGDMRGRGVGAALTRRAMVTGRAAAATTAVLQASTLGERVYRALGFTDGPLLSLYDWQPV